MMSRATYYSYRLRQLTGIPLTRICEVASEIAYETLLKDPELLQRTRKNYAVRTPERQLEIDLSRGYVRLVPLEYFEGFEDHEPGTMIDLSGITTSELQCWFNSLFSLSRFDRRSKKSSLRLGTNVIKM